MQRSALAPSLSAKGISVSLSKIRALFVSATAKDVKVYRKRVQQALQQAGLRVSLQEDLVEGAVDIVQLCRTWLHQSDAYIGVYGFRYGWIPDNETNSITHLECKWAFSRWPADQPCPIFIFLPKKRSKAEKFLKKAADTALREEFPDSRDRREASKRRQADFLSWVGSQSRFVQEYADEIDLCVRAIISVELWNRKALEGALKGRKQGGVDEIPSSLLGAIDREPQLEALEEILVAVGARTDVSSACVLVHGPDGMGQYEFLSFLGEWLIDEWVDWRPSANVHTIRRQPRQDTAALLRAAFAQLAPERQPRGDLAAAVAKAALDRCREQPQVLLLSDVDCIEGGLMAFHGSFWSPVFAAMRASRQPSVHKHPLVVIVTSSTALPAPPSQPLEAVLWTGAHDSAIVDYRKLVPLPRLVPFEKRDVGRWLQGAVADWLNPAGRTSLGTMGRKQVAERVTTGGGEPRRVFEEVRKTRIWADNE